MVLEDLGRSLSSALQSMGSKTVVDEEALKECMNGISRALMAADVNIRLVTSLVTNVITQAVFEEMVKMLTCGPPLSSDKHPSKFTKGKQKIVMFVGLQGAGKTTTIMKYAHYYKSKGFKPAMVCADTFRAGAFDQLKQNATKIQVPFFGDYSEVDPAKIARTGVELFKQQGRDLILVDTSGRHRQQAALFEEMRQVSSAVGPDLVIFVMDGSIGQAALEQAQAFKDSVAVGAVIMTKMDGHAKGGGALSAVAATQSPIVFIGTGEHMDQFEVFDPNTFVGRLLDIGDIKGLMERIQEAVPEEEQAELMERLMEGEFTLRLMREQLTTITKMGPLSQVMSMIPGMGAMSGMMNDQASGKRLKVFYTVMDSMTNKELDTTDTKKLLEPTRVQRIARGAGVHPSVVIEMIEEFKRMGSLMGSMRGLNLPKKGGDLNMRQVQQMAGKMSGLLPQNMMSQLGGMGGLANLMKTMQKMEPSMKKMGLKM